MRKSLPTLMTLIRLRTVYKHLLMDNKFVGFNVKPPIGSAAPEKKHPAESMKATYKFIPE